MFGNNFCPRILCVSVSEFLSQNFWFFGKRTFFVTGILKRKLFLHVKSECFLSMYQNLRVFIKINIMKKLTSLQFSLCIFVAFFSHDGVHV